MSVPLIGCRSFILDFGLVGGASVACNAGRGSLLSLFACFTTLEKGTGLHLVMRDVVAFLAFSLASPLMRDVVALLAFSFASPLSKKVPDSI
jgi:hypothetical protein